jgi:acyl carrier protein
LTDARGDKIITQFDEASVFELVAAAMRRTFRLNSETVVSPSTTSADIEGWDSLSHSLLLMEIEDVFGIELPIDRIFDLADVQDLVTLIRFVQSSARG